MSSIRSRQTGHVGSSTRHIVLKASDLVDKDVLADGTGFAMAGVKGSFDILGKLSGSLLVSCAWKDIDLMKTM